MIDINNQVKTIISFSKKKREKVKTLISSKKTVQILIIGFQYRCSLNLRHLILLFVDKKFY